MAAKNIVRVSNEREKEFLNKFRLLCETRYNWQVWADLIITFAISIANALEQNKEIREKREKEYLSCVQKLGGQKVPAELFNVLIMALEENPRQDFLGKMFMLLELGNHWKGQFFTPYTLCEMMTEIDTENLQKKTEENGWFSINDCACGAGAMLIAAANTFREHNINYQQQTLFVGQDIDRIAGMMCYIQLSLLGCPGYVVIADTITSPLVGDHVLFPVEKTDQEFWYTPMWYSDLWMLRKKLHKSD